MIFNKIQNQIAKKRSLFLTLILCLFTSAFANKGTYQIPKQSPSELRDIVSHVEITVKRVGPDMIGVVNVKDASDFEGMGASERLIAMTQILMRLEGKFKLAQRGMGKDIPNFKIQFLKSGCEEQICSNGTIGLTVSDKGFLSVQGMGQERAVKLLNVFGIQEAQAQSLMGMFTGAVDFAKGFASGATPDGSEVSSFIAGAVLQGPLAPLVTPVIGFLTSNPLGWATLAGLGAYFLGPDIKVFIDHVRNGRMFEVGKVLGSVVKNLGSAIVGGGTGGAFWKYIQKKATAGGWAGALFTRLEVMIQAAGKVVTEVTTAVALAQKPATDAVTSAVEKTVAKIRPKKKVKGSDTSDHPNAAFPSKKDQQAAKQELLDEVKRNPENRKPFSSDDELTGGLSSPSPNGGGGGTSVLNTRSAGTKVQQTQISNVNKTDGMVTSSPVQSRPNIVSVDANGAYKALKEYLRNHISFSTPSSNQAKTTLIALQAMLAQNTVTLSNPEQFALAKFSIQWCQEPLAPSEYCEQVKPLHHIWKKQIPNTMNNRVTQRSFTMNWTKDFIKELQKKLTNAPIGAQDAFQKYLDGTIGLDELAPFIKELEEQCRKQALSEEICVLVRELLKVLGKVPATVEQAKSESEALDVVEALIDLDPERAEGSLKVAEDKFPNLRKHPRFKHVSEEAFWAFIFSRRERFVSVAELILESKDQLFPSEIVSRSQISLGEGDNTYGSGVFSANDYPHIDFVKEGDYKIEDPFVLRRWLRLNEVTTISLGVLYQFNGKIYVPSSEILVTVVAWETNVNSEMYRYMARPDGDFVRLFNKIVTNWNGGLGRIRKYLWSLRRHIKKNEPDPKANK